MIYRPIILNLLDMKLDASPRSGVLRFLGGCSAGNFDNHPIAKLQKNQICNPYSNKIFCFTLQSINLRTTLRNFATNQQIAIMQEAPDILTTFFSSKNKGLSLNVSGKRGYRPQPHIHVPKFLLPPSLDEIEPIQSGGVLNSHFGIGVRPEGPQMGA